MDAETLSQLNRALEESQRQKDWKAALDSLFVSLRGLFVFDNVAIYLEDPQSKTLEAVYARAVGRGKTAEADAAWGAGMANVVFERNEIVLHEPPAEPSSADRLQRAYLLGLPLRIGGRLAGALLFIRFGGPSHSDLHIQLAQLHAFGAAAILTNRDLAEARVQLDSVQRQMRLQDDFVSTITHELRTPLGFIKGYSTSLLREDAEWDEATQREFLQIIDEEADRLSRLIEDMLESSRLHSKTLQFKFSPVRIDSLVRDVAARMSVRRPELQIIFDLQPVPVIPGDGKRLSQVFENLFGNAVKYAPNSAVTVVMYAAAGVIRVSVADKGEGIPREYLPYIFERFYRVPGERSIPGTGLGLYICKQIIEAHGGKIWAESTLGLGTTFFIELPVREIA